MPEQAARSSQQNFPCRKKNKKKQTKNPQTTSSVASLSFISLCTFLNRILNPILHQMHTEALYFAKDSVPEYQKPSQRKKASF